MKEFLNSTYGLSGRRPSRKPEMQNAKIYKIEQKDTTIANAFRTFVNDSQWLSIDEIHSIINVPNSLNKAMTPDYLRDAITEWLDTSQSISGGNGIMYMPDHKHTIAYAEFNPSKVATLSPICHDYHLASRNGSMMEEANKWLSGLNYAKNNPGEKIILLHLYSSRGYNEAKEHMTLVTYLCTYGDILKYYQAEIDTLEKNAIWISFLSDVKDASKETGVLHVARGIMKGTVKASERTIYDALCLMRDTNHLVPGDISSYERARDIMFEFNKYSNAKKPVVIIADQYLNKYYMSSTTDDDRADAALFLKDIISSKASGHGTKSSYVIFRKRKKSMLMDVTIIKTSQFDDYSDNLEMTEINDLVIDFAQRNGKGFKING